MNNKIYKKLFVGISLSVLVPPANTTIFILSSPLIILCFLSSYPFNISFSLLFINYDRYSYANIIVNDCSLILRGIYAPMRTIGYIDLSAIL